eukprot:772427-Rhodomonas_salina.3
MHRAQGFDVMRLAPLSRARFQHVKARGHALHMAPGGAERSRSVEAEMEGEGGGAWWSGRKKKGSVRAAARRQGT